MEGKNTQKMFIWLVLCALVIQIVPVTITGDTWVQTTQEDFEGGETWNTNVTLSPGNVTLELNLDWWDSNWKYRIPVNITENSGDDLTEFQVPVEIDTKSLIDSGKMRPDLGDIRFIDPSGQELPHWIEVLDNLSYDEPTDYNASWRFDEGSGVNAYDDSPNNNDGTLLDYNIGNVDGDTPPQWVDGRFGKALKFDGVDDYVLVPYDSTLDLTEFTIDGWIKLNNLEQTQLILQKGYSTDNLNYRFVYYNTKFRAFYEYGSGTDVEILSSLSPVVDTWYYFAMTYGNSKFRLYINGILENETTQINLPGLNLRPLYIGANNNNGPLDAYFNGSIDEVRIYNRALSAEEIRAIYHEKSRIWINVSSLPASLITTIYMYYGNPLASSTSDFDATFTKDYGEDGLVALWHMDEGSGIMTNDSSGNGNHGTLINGPVWEGEDGGQWDGRSDVKFSTGSALEFDGMDDWVNVPHSSDFNIDIGSFEVWMKLIAYPSPGGEARILGKNVFGWNDDLSIVLMPNGSIRFASDKSADNSNPMLFSKAILDSNEWYHITGTWDLNGMKLYIDGNLEVNNAIIVILRGGTAPVTIGGDVSVYFNGIIDEVRIYNRSLDATEIKAHYERRKYANPEPTYTLGLEQIGDWRLEGDWQYRKSITINNTANLDTLTDFQVLIEVNTSSLISAGKMRADCGDIRFIDSSGIPIPYWIESGINTNLTKIWVKVPTIPEIDESNIFMYYGNPSTGDMSDFDATFTKDYGEEGLVGLWHMDKGSGSTAFDSSGNGNDGILVNGTYWDNEDGGQWDGRDDVKFSAGSALEFDGLNDHVDCGNDTSLNITQEFTMEAWIKLSESSRYNTIVSKGSFALKIGPDNKAIFNARNFTTGENWTEVYDTAENGIHSLAVFNGYLYAGTYLNGKIYRSNDGTSWTEVENTTETYIYSLTVFNGYLYAGTEPNGKIYRSGDGTTWAEVEDTTETLIGTLAVFNGYLYAGTRPNGKIYRSNDGITWAEAEDTTENHIVSFAVFNGYLYAGTQPNGKIYRSNDGITWIEVADTTAEYIFSLAVFNGYLYAGEYPDGKIYRSSDGTTWAEVVDTNEENIYSLAVFNGYLYASAGTSSGKIYRSCDGTTWVEVENNTTDITSLAVFNGYLYAGSDGKIYRMGGGFDLYSNNNVSLNEWTHISVTYNGTTVKIYLNGILDRTLKSQITIDTNTFNLLIGNSYGTTIGGFSSTGEENFNGTIDEVRIHNLSLNADEIKAHYKRRKYTSPEPIITIGVEEGRYKLSGTFTSSVFNSLADGTIWNSISWIQTLPPGTDITIATRSGDVITPGPSWSNWSGELSNELGSSIPSPRSRYIQYRATLTTTDTYTTPVLHEVVVDYTLNSASPPTPTSPPDGNWTTNNTPTLSWTYSDPNLDSQIQFEVQIDDDPMFLSVDYTSGPTSSSIEYWDSVMPIADGPWFWRVRARDEYGLWSNWSTYWTINIDTTPPTPPTDMAAEPNSWTNVNSFIVNWTDPGDFSGVKLGAWYKIGSPPTSNSDGTWQAAKPIMVTSLEGQQTIYIWLEDNLGNVDYQNNATTLIYLDTIPPSAPINLNAVPDSWTSANSFSINWTNPLDDSGVKVGAWYKIGAPPTSSSDGIWTDTKPFTVTSSEGQQSIYVWLEDNVGNVDNLNNASVNLYLDTTPPETFTLVADPSGWTSNNQPIITFSTTDSASGMSHYEVQVDSGSFTTQTSPYTLPPQTDGTHAITVRAYDNAGNYRESSVEVYIDTTPPEPFTPTADPNGWTTNNQPQIIFSTTDVISGISHYEVKIDSGSFVTQTSPYTLLPQTDGTDVITVRAYDNAGNYREGIVEIYIDSTPPLTPSEIGATPNSWTKSNSFLINWTNPIETDTSGIKTGVWYKIGSPPTSNTDGTWIGEKPITVTSQEGEQTIYIWLEDNLGNVDYNNYGTTTLYLDTTPPGPPTDVTASPSSWTFVNSFNVDWINPFDNSGVKTGAWYKIGSPPTSDEDGTWIGEKPFTVSTSEGETVIYIWLEDNLGNRNYQNYGFTSLYLDSTAPSITHLPVTHAKKGEAITISATVTDNVIVKTVTLYYKKQGDENFEKITMNIDGEVYSADIPSSFVTKQKIEYYITASDEINTATYPSSGATTDYFPIDIEDEDVLFTFSWLWFLLVLLIVLALLVLFMSRRRGREEGEVGVIAEDESQPEFYHESELHEDGSGISELEEEREDRIMEGEQEIPKESDSPEEEPTKARAESGTAPIPVPPLTDTQMTNDEIFDSIKKKFEEGKISEETFEDFKKRYKKE